jgi:hypothetical protein
MVDRCGHAGRPGGRNLHERAAEGVRDGVLHDATGGLPLTAFQSGDGWVDMLLAPDLLPAVFGPEPALLLAPMRTCSSRCRWTPVRASRPGCWTTSRRSTRTASLCW